MCVSANINFSTIGHYIILFLVKWCIRFYIQIKYKSKNKPVPQLKVFALIIFILACFALDVATQANFF